MMLKMAASLSAGYLLTYGEWEILTFFAGYVFIFLDCVPVVGRHRAMFRLTDCCSVPFACETNQLTNHALLWQFFGSC